MLRFILVLALIAQSFWGISQTPHHYYDGAIEKLKNRSWVHEKNLIGDSSTANDPFGEFFMKSHPNYFLHNNNCQWNVAKYEKRIECSSVTLYTYSVDTGSGIIGGRIHLCELEDWVFIDSCADTKNTYFFVSESDGEFTRDGILTGSVCRLSFLSDSTFVVSGMSTSHTRKLYYKQCPTPCDFYPLYGIKPD